MDVCFGRDRDRSGSLRLARRSRPGADQPWCYAGRLAALAAGATGIRAVGALGLLLLSHRTLPRGTATAVQPRIGPLILPVFGLSILLFPYLPWVPDLVPALQMIAGPARPVIWLAIVAQIVWVLWQVRLLRADWLQRWTLRRSAIAIGVLTAAISGLAASRLHGTVLFPSGDEPHYLVIAQSLWRDHDFKIENNHARGDYREYFAPAARASLSDSRH